MSVNEVNQSTGALKQAAGSFSDMVYADAPVGAIQAFGGNTAPLGWLMCDGSAVSRTTYAALFAVIGTRYGSGDGSTTFNLPSREAGAAVYPSADGNVLSESNYIIKAIKTAVPADIQSELDLKQDITDNMLQTTAKTVPGAINEINTEILKTSTKVLTSYKGIICLATKTGNIVTLLFGGSATEDIPSNQVLFSLTGALETIAQQDIFVTMSNVPGQRIILGSSTVYMAGAIATGAALRGCLIYPATNFDELT